MVDANSRDEPDLFNDRIVIRGEHSDFMVQFDRQLHLLRLQLQTASATEPARVKEQLDTAIYEILLQNDRERFHQGLFEIQYRFECLRDIDGERRLWPTGDDVRAPDDDTRIWSAGGARDSSELDAYSPQPVAHGRAGGGFVRTSTVGSVSTSTSMWSHQAVNGDVVELEVDEESLRQAGVERTAVRITNLEPGSSASDVATGDLPDSLTPFVRSSFVEILPHGVRDLKNAMLRITKRFGRFNALSGLVMIRKERPGTAWEVLSQRVHISDGGNCASIAIRSFSFDALVDKTALDTRDLDAWLAEAGLTKYTPQINEYGYDSLDKLRKATEEDVVEMAQDSDLQLKKPDRRIFVDAWKELVAAFVSAFAPRSVKPDSTFQLNVWVYVRMQMEAVVTQERKEGRVQADQHGPLILALGVFKIRLKLADAFRAEEPLATLEWEGKAVRAPFQVRCLPEATSGSHDCQADIWAEGKKVAVLNFELEVDVSHPISPMSEPDQEVSGVQLATADSAGALVRTTSQKLDELLVGQQEARDEREQLRQEFQQKLDKLGGQIKDGMELLQGRLGDLAQQQQAVSTDVKESLQMLSDQSSQLTRLGDTTAATFTALKSLSEHEHDVPRLVTITLKDAPEWKGAWHDNIGGNLLSKAQEWVGTHQFFQLHFLCEKTLLPVEGEAGYELKMPKEAFAEFMKEAGPILSATCAVLKLVTLIGRPVAKIAGIDLPEIGRINMDGVRDIKLGESTVGEAFAGTGIASMLDQIETTGQGEPEPEPDTGGAGPEPEPEAEAEPELEHGTALLDFADNAITQVEGLATWAGVPLQEEEEDGDDALESEPLWHRLPSPHQPPELRAAELLGVQALLLGLGLLEVALLVGVDDVLELDQLQRKFFFVFQRQLRRAVVQPSEPREARAHEDEESKGGHAQKNQSQEQGQQTHLAATVWSRVASMSPAQIFGAASFRFVAKRLRLSSPGPAFRFPPRLLSTSRLCPSPRRRHPYHPAPCPPAAFPCPLAPCRHGPYRPDRPAASAAPP
eukprot:COSAG04_NODE_1818_length_5501_cov_101.025361_2_plen_1027_part_00